MNKKGLNVKRTWGGKEKLENLIKKEKNTRIKERLQAVLWRLENETYTEISNRLKRRKNTITDWVKRWNKGGYEGIIDEPKAGAIPKLTPEEEKEVIETVNQSTRITCKILKFKIQDEFGKEYTIGGITAMLHRHNLSWKKPKKKDYRQNEQGRKEYQESLKKRPKILIQKQWSGI
jgi:transposase